MFIVLVDLFCSRGVVVSWMYVCMCVFMFVDLCVIMLECGVEFWVLWC